MAKKRSLIEYLNRSRERGKSDSQLSRELGVHRSVVGKIRSGKLSGDRYRKEIIRSAQGQQVRPAPPTERTPKRVREPARIAKNPNSDIVTAGAPTKRSNALANQIQKSIDKGRPPAQVTFVLSDVQRSASYKRDLGKADKRTSGEWSVPVTADDLATLQSGDTESMLDILRSNYQTSWISDATIKKVRYHESD